MSVINIGLNETVINSIIKTLQKNDIISKAVIFGSRAKGNYRRYSDIDVALWGDDLDYFDAGKIASQLDDLPMAYKFDITVYDTIKNQDLKNHIDRVGITIYEKQKL